MPWFCACLKRSHLVHFLKCLNSRLYHVSKIPKQHSWISTSLHVTKLLVTLNTYVEPGTKSNWDYMNYLVTFFLCLVLTYIAIFETTSEITSDKVCSKTTMLKLQKYPKRNTFSFAVGLSVYKCSYKDFVQSINSQTTYY